MKRNLRIIWMFLLVGFWGINVFAGDKGTGEPFIKLEWIKEFKTGKEYKAYKKAHPEIFREGDKRIRIEGDRLRFYDEDGRLLRERKIYKGKEIFEGKNEYGRDEKYRFYSFFEISPRENLVVEVRWKATVEYSTRDKIIIYNGKGEIIGEIDSLCTYPYILPEARYIIGICGGEGWVRKKVYIYDTKGRIVKTIEFGIDYPEVGFVIVSSDGGYAIIVISDLTENKTEVVLIDKGLNIIWRKKFGGRIGSDVAALSTFGEYAAFMVSRWFIYKLVVLDKGGNEILRKEIDCDIDCVGDLYFIDNTRILAYKSFTTRNDSVFMVLMDPVSDKILCREPIRGYRRVACMKIKVYDNILVLGSLDGGEDFGPRSYISVFRWKASDEMYLKGGKR